MLQRTLRPCTLGSLQRACTRRTYLSYDTGAAGTRSVELFAQRLTLPPNEPGLDAPLGSGEHQQPRRHLVCLHGLLGSSDNWRLVARRLRNAALPFPLTVHMVDLRNHGRSPHMPQHTYAHMLPDLQRYLEREVAGGKATLVGHSMGGKLAMLGALAFPELIDSMLIVDASPAVYRHSHDITFDALKAVPINDIRTKHEADAVLVERLPHLSKAERNYFLANLTHKEQSGGTAGLRWAINLDVLARDQAHVQDFPVQEVLNGKEAQPFAGKVVFFGSRDSGRMEQDFVAEIPKYFANYELDLLPGGHFIHSEHPQRFHDQLTRLLTRGLATQHHGPA